MKSEDCNAVADVLYPEGLFVIYGGEVVVAIFAEEQISESFASFNEFLVFLRYARLYELGDLWF